MFVVVAVFFDMVLNVSVVVVNMLLCVVISDMLRIPNISHET